MEKEYVGIRQATKDGYLKCEIGGVADFLYPTSKHRRGRVQGDGQISPTITAENTGVCKVEKNEFCIEDGVLSANTNITKGKDAPDIDWENCEYRIRKLTAKECYRLMDVTDEDADKMLSINSQTQCYKQAGNSLVVTMFAAVLSQLNIQGIKPWNHMTLEEKHKLTAIEINKREKTNE